MRLLIDTHLLLWAVIQPNRLPAAANSLFEDPANDLVFSAINIWEVAIKRSRDRADFDVDPGVLRRTLLGNGYAELPLTGDHAIAMLGLPPLHKDPFDRALIAQATFEGMTLLTSDSAVARYPGPVRLM